MNKRTRVWVVDDDASIRWVLDKALGSAGFAATVFDNADDVLARVRRTPPDVIITDIRMPGTSGLDLLKALGEQLPQLPVIVMTAHSDLDSAVSAYRGGAFEYLPKPFDLEEAVALVGRALQKKTAQSVDQSADSAQPAGMIGEAPAMQEVFRVIGRLSKSHMNVLISGESGTGKELAARAIYRNSPRAEQSLVAINTAAIPAELLESELFGHEKGAFTGAQEQRQGRFEQADHGTLFLDEIGAMPFELQTRLLRVLADNTFYRVGGHKQLAVDVRVIAATNQDLEGRVRDQRFREDLYHRLNVIAIRLPALRERREDVPALAKTFLTRAAGELEVESKQLDEAALAMLVACDWPGNVRQLENLCRRLTVMAPGRIITTTDLPTEVRGQGAAVTGTVANDWQQLLVQAVTTRLERGQHDILAEVGPQFERTLLRTALSFTGGRKQEAARWLGWGRNTLTRKLKELGID
ncbi:MAG: nitrogen regulation protein NR(I) [Arenicellales bacterium]|jgi:two-component system nitrogen regulation response regulator GlnG|nr:nitrogen regulation protein NR(I) [Acidiferrobacteraceae bacterium]MDP6140449.1 nitrogen regulation protein NR(I) [Arenicellales bacterium]MDP7120490.1 nitrogen regulation protein NR(I) [Arenicellales bacterium]MDP7193258.1 nitrogen regulation protein NR(I) [Arenicellales bacterium]MDP7489338.1 nitrogen regulation protein NR(I) [Arenicellales bacterium]